MSRFLLTLAMLGLMSTKLAPHHARGDDDEKAKASSIWMKQKLSASQNILAGLTKEDYEAIEKNAQSMVVVGSLEKWVRSDIPGYQKMMRDFEYANKALDIGGSRKKPGRSNDRIHSVNCQLRPVPQAHSGEWKVVCLQFRLLYIARST